MTKPFFPGLAGINKQREITARKDTSLEQLAVIGEDAIREYHTRTTPYNNNKENYGLCEELTRKLAKKLPPYTTDTLQGLVLAYANKKEQETKAIVRGMYTGILASQLTQRNHEQGKRTRIHLDGGDNSFPYLLYFAHTLDEVAITNFCGDNILRCAASYGGHAGTITLANITGDRAGYRIAGYHGRVGVVTLAHITGECAGARIASGGGRVDGAITLANITGDRAGEWIASGGGRVGVVTLANITGDRAGAGIAWNDGRVDGAVTLAHITGNNAGAWIARNGRVDGALTLANISGDYAGARIAWNDGRVDGAVTLAHITGDNAGDGIAEYSGRVDGAVTLTHITGDNAGANIARDGGRVGGLFAHKNEGNRHFEDCDVKRTPLHGHKNASRAETLLARLKLEQDPEQVHAAAQELAETLHQVRQ